MSNFTKIVGQLWGRFNPNESLHKKIWNKYYEQYSNYTQRMISLDSIKIEAEPGTVVYIKEDKDKGFERHIIGDTCTLEVNTNDNLIEGIYFTGIHLEPATEKELERDELPDTKFYETGVIIYNEYMKIDNLIKNGVYTFADAFLPALEHWSEAYSYRSIEQDFDNNTTSANLINIENDNPIYGLLLERREMCYISEDGGILVEEPYTENINKNSDGYDNTVLAKTDKQYAALLQTLIKESNNRMIWYNEKWHIFTKDNDILCPVEGLMDYYCEVMKGRYSV